MNENENVTNEIKVENAPETVAAEQSEAATAVNEVIPAVSEEPGQGGNAEPHTAPSGNQRQNQAPAPKKDGTTGKTVAALILGISGIALSCTVFFGIFGAVCGAIGLIFAIKERKENPCGLATASFILSIIALVLGGLSAVSCVACIGMFSFMDLNHIWGDPIWNEIYNEIQYY